MDRMAAVQIRILTGNLTHEQKCCHSVTFSCGTLTMLMMLMLIMVLMIMMDVFEKSDALYGEQSVIHRILVLLL